ncbi:hypothetical protein Ccrd_013467 [Cynara cardunculus var. scolymus]|uniref:Uncharacterized protein n=1 Tax=Cynara cardunculus var. scolymus TaxID=59895 RepID=A0A124SH22_CYNCS|nr:hypothetical protein Ccrd_013467 [Cynara cardunculus var. scolymus]
MQQQEEGKGLHRGTPEHLSYVNPWGCGNTSKKLFHLTYSPLDAGIATCTKCPVQAKELTPKSPDK